MNENPREPEPKSEVNRAIAQAMKGIDTSAFAAITASQKSVMAQAMMGIDTSAFAAITAGHNSVITQAMKGIDTIAFAAITAGHNSVITQAMKGIDTIAFAAITASQKSVIAQAMKGIDASAFAVFLQNVEIDDEAVVRGSAEALQSQPLSPAHWLLWIWLVRILAFAAVLNAELRIQEGPGSILKTALEVLDALQLGDVVTPTAAAAGAGAAFGKFGPKRPTCT